MDDKKGPNLAKWKEYRCALMEGNEEIGTQYTQYKHEGNNINSRDIYEYLKKSGLFNVDLTVEINNVNIKNSNPLEITGFRVEAGKLIIDVI